MNRYIKNIFFVCAAFFSAISTYAQTTEQIFKDAGSHAHPKVNVSWKRYYDNAGITEICKKIAAAHPDLDKLESIGKSFKRRDMWVLIITDYKKKSPDKRPGMYIDGNIHSNE